MATFRRLIGTTLVYGEGKREPSELTLHGEKIYDLGGMLGFHLAEETDLFAEGSLVYPGKLYDAPFWDVLYQPAAYREKMKKLYRLGYTSFVDWVPFHSLQTLPQDVRYHQALHADAPFDYTLKIFARAADFSLQLLRAVDRLKLVELVLHVDTPPLAVRLDRRALKDFATQSPLSIRLDLPKDPVPQENGCFVEKSSLVNWGKAWYDELVSSGFRVCRQFSSPDGLETDGLEMKAMYAASDRHVEHSARDAQRLQKLMYMQSGLYGIKGRLAPGADADLVIDTADGRHTYLRGKRIEEDHLPYGEGRFLYPRQTFMLIDSFLKKDCMVQ
ncbi:MAG: hypothetical protein IMX04_08735 [Candidatus Carbobacillus altaicus]|nr:hypothetical protein [Candidatus Carbobacillus altaicus]